MPTLRCVFVYGYFSLHRHFGTFCGGHVARGFLKPVPSLVFMYVHRVPGCGWRGGGAFLKSGRRAGRYLRVKPCTRPEQKGEGWRTPSTQFIFQSSSFTDTTFGSCLQEYPSESQAFIKLVMFWELVRGRCCSCLKWLLRARWDCHACLFPRTGMRAFRAPKLDARETA